MAKISSFQKHVARYDAWFDANRWAYVAELKAVGALLPVEGRRVEIGVGTGRFAAPLGINIGIEPAAGMGAVARKRGIEVVAGVAEKLPFRDFSFDSVLMVTTVCFVDDIRQTFLEAARVLADHGCCLVALVDKNSALGRSYEQRRRKSVFYREATFYSVDTIVALMWQAGFHDFQFTQTIFKMLSATTAEEPVESGYGRGSFVVVRGIKKPLT
ncbi:MAG: methyltransferase type 11 [Deltaproteobacteria bacterium RIFOXYD12_FULL_57_12]|nr:MAG: methyltransferase type 11 [Deltaproteobacteria bacterium RIFOXYD12_FULL_57_12]